MLKIEMVLNESEIKRLYDKLGKKMGEYMFYRDEVLSRLKTGKVGNNKFFNKVVSEIEQREFDVCFSIEREVYLRKEVELTEKEELFGVEVRRNLEKEYSRNMIDELKESGFRVWCLEGREWGMYFILKRW